MSNSRTILMAVGALAFGIVAVIAADRLGWIRTNEPQVQDQDHASRTPSAPVTAAERTALPSDIQLVESSDPVFRSQRAPAVSCSTERQLIQFANADVADRAGLTLEAAQRRPITRTLQCNAELTFNGDRFAHIAPRASGVVHRVEKTLGDRVKEGETLAIIDSADLGAAKAEYLQAIAAERLWRTHLERQSSLAESGVTSRRDLLEAETRCAEACINLSRAMQRLQNLGVAVSGVTSSPPPAAAAHNAVDHGPSRTGLDMLHVDPSALSSDGSHLRITAPFDGVIVERHAVLGEVVDTEHPMFAVAGLSPESDSPSLWMMLDIYETDAPLVALGQRVLMHQPGRPGEPVSGVIAWISPQVDPVTRTLKARADITGANIGLRANTFGRAMITIHDQEELLVVPRAAVQWEGCCNIVFVRKSDTQYQPRKVKLGYETGGWCVIAEGLQPDDLVVTDGSFLLKTEILKGSIGAGCCADH